MSSHWRHGQEERNKLGSSPCFSGRTLWNQTRPSPVRTGLPRVTGQIPGGRTRIIKVSNHLVRPWPRGLWSDGNQEVTRLPCGVTAAAGTHPVLHSGPCPDVTCSGQIWSPVNVNVQPSPGETLTAVCSDVQDQRTEDVFPDRPHMF